MRAQQSISEKMKTTDSIPPPRPPRSGPPGHRRHRPSRAGPRSAARWEMESALWRGGGHAVPARPRLGSPAEAAHQAGTARPTAAAPSAPPVPSAPAAGGGLVCPPLPEGPWASGPLTGGRGPNPGPASEGFRKAYWLIVFILVFCKNFFFCQFSVLFSNYGLEAGCCCFTCEMNKAKKIYSKYSGIYICVYV